MLLPDSGPVPEMPGFEVHYRVWGATWSKHIDNSLPPIDHRAPPTGVSVHGGALLPSNLLGVLIIFPYLSYP